MEAAIRRRGRIDITQPEIVKALRAIGATVAITSSLGDGFPDLVVGWRGENTMLEVKTGQARLSKDEAEWHAAWRGQVAIVRTPEEALLAVMGVK